MPLATKLEHWTATKWLLDQLPSCEETRHKTNRLVREFCRDISILQHGDFVQAQIRCCLHESPSDPREHVTIRVKTQGQVETGRSHVVHIYALGDRGLVYDGYELHPEEDDKDEAENERARAAVVLSEKKSSRRGGRRKRKSSNSMAASPPQRSSNNTLGRDNNVHGGNRQPESGRTGSHNQRSPVTRPPSSLAASWRRGDNAVASAPVAALCLTPSRANRGGCIHGSQQTKGPYNKGAINGGDPDIFGFLESDSDDEEPEDAFNEPRFCR